MYFKCFLDKVHKTISISMVEDHNKVNKEETSKDFSEENLINFLANFEKIQKNLI